ncbi:MAG: PDZ domain-containing protein [Candidatus Solibacter sp.]
MTLSRRNLLASLLAAPALRAAPGDPLSLPTRRNDFHQLLVPARIDNSPPLWCELDSGGGGPLVFLDAAHAAMIGVRATHLGRSAGPVEGSLAPDWRSRVTLSLPGLQFPEQEVVIKAAPLPGDKDASIGMLVLKAFVVELDHDAAVVRLHAPSSFRYSGPGREFAFTLLDNNPFTTATLTLREGRRVEAKMVIDTGAVASLAYFSRSFALQHQLAEGSLATAPDTMNRTACRIERFALGSYGVNRPVVHAFGTPGFGGQTEPDGMIAADFLRRFRVFLDYSRNRMILEPNRAYQDPPAFDASGLRVHRLPETPDALRIYEVLPGTPARENGLRASDLLISLDDVPMSRMSPGMVQEVLTRDGSEVLLMVQRAEDVFTVRLKLRRLL